METPSQFFHTSWSTPDDDSLRKNKEISIDPLKPTTTISNIEEEFEITRNIYLTSGKVLWLASFSLIVSQS